MTPLWLILIPVWVHIDCAQLDGWEDTLWRAFDGASERYQNAVSGPTARELETGIVGDWPCPVELRPSEVRIWDENTPGFVTPRKNYTPRTLPFDEPTLVVQCGDYGQSRWSITYNTMVLNGRANWGLAEPGGWNTGEWILAHEFGHRAGLHHSGGQCSLLWYGINGQPCGGCPPLDDDCPDTSHRLRQDQCEAIIAVAQPWEPMPPTPELL